MSPVGFEPTILVSERSQTHALDRTAIGIGIRTHDPSKQAAEDPPLRPHGHWDRRFDPRTFQSVVGGYTDYADPATKSRVEAF